MKVIEVGDVVCGNSVNVYLASSEDEVEVLSKSCNSTKKKRSPKTARSHSRLLSSEAPEFVPKARSLSVDADVFVPRSQVFKIYPSDISNSEAWNSQTDCSFVQNPQCNEPCCNDSYPSQNPLSPVFPFPTSFLQNPFSNTIRNVSESMSTINQSISSISSVQSQCIPPSFPSHVPSETGGTCISPRNIQIKCELSPVSEKPGTNQEGRKRTYGSVKIRNSPEYTTKKKASLDRERSPATNVKPPLPMKLPGDIIKQNVDVLKHVPDYSRGDADSLNKQLQLIKEARENDIAMKCSIETIKTLKTRPFEIFPKEDEFDKKYDEINGKNGKNGKNIQEKMIKSAFEKPSIGRGKQIMLPRPLRTATGGLVMLPTIRKSIGSNSSKKEASSSFVIKSTASFAEESVNSSTSSRWALEVEEENPSSISSPINFKESYSSASNTPPTPSTPYEGMSPSRSYLPSYILNRDALPKGSVWDSHCHLDFLSRKLAREGVRNGENLEVCLGLEQDKEPLEEAFGGCVANFCDPRDWSQGRDLREVSFVLKNCQRQKKVYITLGCHPHFADRLGGVQVEQLLRLAKKWDPRVVAIGECGLDNSRKNDVSMHIQKQAFSAQVELALKLKLPIVLHIRDAEEEGRQLLRELKVPYNWPMHRHCFTGSWTEAYSWLQLYPSSKLGLTAKVTYRHATPVHEVARRVSLNQLLLETDAPYFLPSGVTRATYGLHFAHPGHVVHVAAQIAALRNISVEEVLTANRRNIKEVYGIETGVGVQ